MDTLKVKMNVSIASADWSFAPGDEVEFDVELAEAWLESGHALPIKGEKVNKDKLSDGVEYLGFGNFSAHGQVVRGKKEANEAHKDMPSEVVEAHRLAKEAAEEAEAIFAAEAEEAARLAEEARLAAEAEAGDADVDGNSGADGGADLPTGGEGAPQG